MGDRLTEQPQTSLTPYGDIFDAELPKYMAIGMPYDMFWDGEFGSKRAFRSAYKLRIENEQRITDVNNWFMGQYIIKVLQAVPLLVAGLNVKETTQLPEYPQKPLLEEAEERKKEDQRRKKEEDQQKLAMAMFHAMATQFNKNFSKADKKPVAVKSGQ